MTTRTIHNIIFQQLVALIFHSQYHFHINKYIYIKKIKILF
jgi:hypothetical protein